MSEKTLAIDPTEFYPAKELTKVLIADDSATVRHHLVSMINETPGIEVVGQAKNGEEAIKLAGELRPDVISMDIRMPRMDGLEATRQIMIKYPTPVVIVSGVVETDIELSFAALESGALAVVEKPPDRRNPLFEEKHKHLLKTLMAMAGVSVVRHGTLLKKPQATTEERKEVVEVPRIKTHMPEVVAIGASAGGPSALIQLLGGLPEDFPLPIVIVQHIPDEFVSGLVKWLDRNTPLTVQIATDYQVLRPGVVHLSPGTAHLKVIKSDEELLVRLIAEKGKHRHQPSINVLFDSVAEVCKERAIGLILTGMGEDGAEGLLKMYNAGAHTLAQDKESSTVFGMPAAAIANKAVEEVKSLSDLPSAILKLL